jgi:hypothetical protein
MARPARQVERVRFGADGTATIVEWMTRLAAAGDGWINLVPQTEESGDRPRSLQFFTLLSGGGLGVTMGTWLPSRTGRRGRTRPTLGITHVTPGRARERLRSVGLVLPTHWTLQQDHPRRGLVLGIDAGTPQDEVLSWAIQAITVLASGPVRGWSADVHLPIER